MSVTNGLNMPFDDDPYRFESVLACPSVMLIYAFCS